MPVDRDAHDAEERHALAELGYALVREGRWDDARAVWEGLATIAPADEAPLRALAVIAAYEQRWPDVVALAGAALERRPDAAAALLLRGEALLRTGRYQEAARDLDRLVRLRPADDGEQALRRRAAALAARLRRPGG